MTRRGSSRRALSSVDRAGIEIMGCLAPQRAVTAGPPGGPTLAAHNLALDLAESVNDRLPHPALIRALRVPERWEQNCLDLGRDRNRVKHRGLRHEAERCASRAPSIASPDPAPDF